MKVTFENLGGSFNKTVTAKIKEVSYDELYRVVKPYLMSKWIDFAYDAETKTGSVFVGGFRWIGDFKVEVEDERT
jgi:hypothetical protein